MTELNDHLAAMLPAIPLDAISVLGDGDTQELFPVYESDPDSIVGTGDAP